MKVLVTRPEPAGSELVAAIKAKGAEAFALPLIQVGPGLN